MGQCAVVPPSVSDEYDDTSFLVSHRPDRGNRCILDRDEVDSMLHHQAEVTALDAQKTTLQAFGVIEHENADDPFFDSCDDSDSDSGILYGHRRAPSQAATTFTNVTIDTDTTLLVSNSDRYAMKANPRNARRSRLHEDTFREQQILRAACREESLPTRRGSKRRSRERRRSYLSSSSSSSSSRGSTFSDVSVNGNREHANMAQFVAFESTDDIQRSPQLHTGRGHNQKSNSGVVGSYPSRELLSVDGKYSCLTYPPAHGTGVATNVLNLSMAAKMSDYYRNQYLRFCPDPSAYLSVLMSTGIPKKRQDSTPTVESISSDGSSNRSDPSVVDLFPGVPSSPVNLAIDGSSFLDMAVTGSLGMVDRNRGRQLHAYQLPKQQKSPDHYIVLLHRRSGIPLAVCALKSLNGSPIVRIYATKQRVYGQRHAATTKDLGIRWSSTMPLYAWAEIVTDGEFPMSFTYSIYMSTGSDGRFEKEPSYRANHTSAGSADICVVGRTEFEREYKGCATISLNANDENDVHMALSVARGVDPALFICFAAIVDEIVEKNMRLHCAALQRSAVRRHQAQMMDF